MNKSFRDLRVWQESVDLAELIYRASEDFPRREHFGLASQIRRSAVSVPSNIAEGQGRLTNGEWLQFLGTARGSLYEIETQLIIAGRLDYLRPDVFQQLTGRATGVGRALSGLIDHVAKQRKHGQRKTDNGQR